MTDKIPFDIEKWKTGKYDVVNNKGKKALSVILHNIDCRYPVSVIWDTEFHQETYSSTGHYDYTFLDPDDDIYLIPKKRKVWIAIERECGWPLENDDSLKSSFAYPTRELLMKSSFIAEEGYIIEVELPE